MIGLRAAAGSPDAKDGIAQYPVGGQLARRGSVSFGMVRRRDDHFGKGLTVSRGPEIGDRLPDHPAAPSVSPDKSHGPVIDIDDPRLAQKVMIPPADNVRQCCSSFSGNSLDKSEERRVGKKV